MRTVRALLIATALAFGQVACPGPNVRPSVVTQALTPSFNPSNTPTQSAFSVLGNGGIGTIVPHDNVTYIGGNFDELAAITGSFARLEGLTAKCIPMAQAEHGEVRSSVPDGNGGFYIGGTFSSVGAEPRAKIARVLADGTVDPNFNPGVPGQNNAVNALAVSNDGGTVYVGGWLR
jgi:hypothetical protein